MEQLRRQLWESGYRPLAVHTGGKKPFGLAWQERARQNPPATITEPLNEAALNTGILCDALRVLDCDIDDPAIMNEIERVAIALLGPAPIRKRHDSARCILLYRAAQGEPAKRKLSGTMGQIEALGHGQQFVAYGKHPDGAPYLWTHDPAPYSRELLTPITESQLSAFFAAVAPIIGAPEPSANVVSQHPAIISEGQRNQTLTSLAGTMWRKGMMPKTIELALLSENAERCGSPLPEAEVREIAKSILRYPSAQSEPDAWPEPKALGGELPPVREFDLQLLPASLLSLVEDTAERMQVPPDYPAVVAVLCLAGVTNRRVTIYPKALDSSWTVIPNLWGGIIAPPGMMKSPVISAITQPLTRIEARWRGDHESATSRYQQQNEEAELRQAAWRQQVKVAQKSGENAPGRPSDPLAAPRCLRLITQDATFEALHVLMSENPAGIMVIRDELTGWLAALERQGREGERAFYLQAWNGDAGFTIDRIGRGSVHVEACCVSILGESSRRDCARTWLRH